MTKEIQISPEPQCIFRATFNSLWDIKNNQYGRGTPSATGITYNGDGSISLATNGQITYVYNRNCKGFRFRLKNVTSFYCKLTSTRSIQIVGGTLSAVGFTSATYYVNGSVGTTVSGTGEVEIVVTDSVVFRVNNLIIGYNGTSYGTFTIDLSEFTNNGYTAQQVANLYKKSTYIEVPTTVSEQLGTLMNVSSCVNSNYTTFDGASSTGFHAISNGGASHYCGTADELSITSGNSYRITFTGALTGVAPSFALADALGGTIRSNVGTLAVGGNSVVLTATATTMVVLQWYNASTVTEFTVSNLSVKNITIPSITTLLKYDSFKGYSRDRTGLRTLTDTSMTYPKNGKGLGMAKFDGSASKIDCGSDFIDTKQVVSYGWLYINSYGTISTIRACVTFNGKFIIFIDATNQRLRATSAGGSPSVNSASNSLKLGSWIFYAVIRKSDTTFTFYIGDKITAPALSGTANQLGDAISVGTNVILGNNSAGTRSLNGLIPQQGIEEWSCIPADYLLQRLTNIWSQSKSYFQ